MSLTRWERWDNICQRHSRLQSGAVTNQQENHDQLSIDGCYDLHDQTHLTMMECVRWVPGLLDILQLRKKIIPFLTFVNFPECSFSSIELPSLTRCTKGSLHTCCTCTIDNRHQHLAVYQEMIVTTQIWGAGLSKLC